MQEFHTIEKKINSAQKIAVFGHDIPDGDAIGSMLGLGMILEKLGKKVSYFTPSIPSKIFNFLKGIDKITDNFDYGDYDILIFVDFSSYSRLGKLIKNNEQYFEKNDIIVFDHHEGDFDHSNRTLLRDTKATSTCEIIFENTVRVRKDYYDEDVATYLYLGLTTDSGNFRYDENSKRIFENALNLINLGANKKLIVDNLINKKSMGTIKFLKILLDRMKEDGEILYTYYDVKELNKYNIDIEQAGYGLTIIQEIEGYKINMSIRRCDNIIKCSLRSKNTNVEQIAKHFGGGGHMYASGFTFPIKKKNFELTKTEILKKINSLIN